MPRRLLLLIALLPCRFAGAQFIDDFEDGDLSTSPAWSGDLDRWTVRDTNGGRRLATLGLAESDTLILRTPTHGPYGTWRLLYGYTGGRLSNFNQVRIRLWSDPAESKAAYYVLIGSNDHTLKLYRERSTNGTRDLIASAADGLLDADSAAIAIRIEHDYLDVWRAWIDGELILEAEGDGGAPHSPGYFEIWVKHTASRGRDHWFDDVGSSPAVESDDRPPDLEHVTVIGPSALSIRFDEPVTTASACHPGAFHATADVQHVLHAACTTGTFTDSLRLEPDAPLPPGAYRLWATDIADPSGNVQASHFLDFDIADTGVAPEPGDLIINEIDYAPEVASSEFVELLNLSSKRLDLGAIRIADTRTDVPVASRGPVAGPGDYIVLTGDAPALHQRFPDVYAIEVDGWPSLNNGGDAVRLLVGDDTLDTVQYVPLQRAGGSLERADPKVPSDVPHNWLESEDPDGATPGRVNSVFRPDVEGPELIFVEQTSSVAVRAVFSEAIPADALPTAFFSLNAASPTVVAPGTPRYSPDFFLLFDEVGPGTLRVSPVADAAGNVTAATSAPVHLLPVPGDLAVNEVLFEPKADEFDGVADQAEFIELRSLSADPLSLNACTVSGPADETGEVDTRPIEGRASGIGPGELAVVTDAASAAMPFFGEVPGTLLRPLGSGSLKLRNQGASITVACGGADIETARFDPDWHHPALASTRGVSLERISALAAADDPRSWTSSTDPSGATPGRLNSASVSARTVEKSLEVTPSPFSPDDDGHVDATIISYRLRTDRAMIRLTIYDSRGRPVRHLSTGKLSPRHSSLVWDGRDDRGTTVRTGIYIVFLEATDAAGGTVERYRATVVAARGFN